MVIKSKIYDFLKKNLGEYLYGFQKNQLDVGLLSGHIDLVNVNFRPSKVNQLLGSLGFPITLKAGLLGKLRLKCHYTSFLSSPIEVEIDELLLIFGPITHLAREDKNMMEDSILLEEEERMMHQPAKPIKPKKHMQGSNGSTGVHRNRSIQGSQLDDDSETPRQNPDLTPRETRVQRPGSAVRPSSGQSVQSVQSVQNIQNTQNPQNIQNVPKTQKVQNSPHVSGSEGSARDDSRQVRHNGTDKNRDDGGRRGNNETEANSKGYQSMKKPPHHPRHYVDDPSQLEEPKKEGLIEKYFSKVLKNLVLTVKSVHIRYEDETYPYLNPYSIGFSLSKLEVKNVSQEWLYKDGRASKRNPRKNAIVKEINLNNFAMYIYSMSTVLIPTSLWEATISSEIGIFEALPAYEVRDLFIMESNTLSSGHPSTFISPTNIQLSVSFYEEAPTLRVSTLVEKANVQFTASMSECVRNFFDYCTNVQIWPLVLRFRPYRRIPERPEKRERRKERKKRREIVRLWFQYAYAFVKTKRAAIRYMKERKKDNELFKKMEKQEKIREKVLKGQREVANSRQASKSASSRRMPGQSDKKLNDILKGYSEKPSKRRPYDGDTYFPKQISNSEIDFNLNSLKMVLFDEDTDIKMIVNADGIFFSMNTLLDEMKTVFALAEVTAGFMEGTKIFDAAKISKGKKVGNEIFALHVSKIYRPAEVIVPNDLYLTLNMYEICVSVAPFVANYSREVLDSFFVVKKGLELDRCFRENVDKAYIEEFARHCKKHKLPKMIGSSLKKFAICKLVSKNIKEFQENLDIHIHDLHSDLSNIMMDIQVDLEGGSLNLCDNKSSTLSISLGKNRASFIKDEEKTSAQALGFSLKTENAPIAIHDFFMTFFGIFSKQVKQIQTCVDYFN